MFERGDASQEGSGSAEPINEPTLPEDITAAELTAGQLQARLLAEETGEPVEELVGDDSKATETVASIEAEGGLKATQQALPVARLVAAHNEDAVPVVAKEPEDEATSDGADEEDIPEVTLSSVDNASPELALGDGGEGRPPVETPRMSGGEDEGDKEETEGDTTSDANETHEDDSVRFVGDRKIVIERRQLENVHVVGVFPPMSRSAAVGVAAAVKDCDVVVLNIGHYPDEPSRLKEERIYNKIASSTTDLEWTSEMVTRALDSNSLTASIVAVLQSTDKEVHLPAVTIGDTPGTSIIIDQYITRQELMETLSYLPPLEVARKVIYERTEKFAAVVELESNVVLEKIQAIVADVGQRRPGATVGIVTSGAHPEFIESLGGEVTEGGAPLRERLEQRPGLGRADLAFREGDIERIALLTDKTLLDLYIIWGTREFFPEEIGNYVTGLSQTQVTQLLTVLEPMVADPESPFEDKAEKVTGFAAQVIDQMLNQGS